MKLSNIKDLVTSKVGRQLLTVQKHSPAILFGVGVVGVVGTVVLASKATLKLEEVLDEHQKNMGLVNDLVRPEYSDEDRNKDKVLLYAQTSNKIIKMYAPAVAVGAISIGCLTGSHVVLTRRNAAVTAAYAALDKGFKEYRQRVVEQYGDDADRNLKYGVVSKKVVEETEDGPKKVKKQTVDQDAPLSIYAKIFDENSTSWSPQPEYNMVFLRCQQQYANDRLRAKGHIFLNEVYDALGIERTKEGQVVGWVRGNGGDDYVDFGIFDKEMKPRHYDFFTGRENAIWLDFNVDGVVYNLI